MKQPLSFSIGVFLFMNLHWSHVNVDAYGNHRPTIYRIFMGEHSAARRNGVVNLDLYNGYVEVGDQLSVPVLINRPVTYFAITAVDLWTGLESLPSRELAFNAGSPIRESSYEDVQVGVPEFVSTLPN